VAVRLRLALESGRPVCTSFEVLRLRDGPPITGKLVKALDVGTAIEQAVQFAGVAASQSIAVLTATGYTIEDGEFSVWARQHEAEAKRNIAAIHRQRKVTDELLAEVARVYLEADEAPTVAGRETVQGHLAAHRQPLGHFGPRTRPTPAI
jgi:hypothetical protein